MKIIVLSTILILILIFYLIYRTGSPVFFGVLALENSDCGIIVLDKDYQFLYANKKSKYMFEAFKDLKYKDNVVEKELWPKDLRCFTSNEIIKIKIKDTDLMASVKKVVRRKEYWIIFLRDVTEETKLWNTLFEQATKDRLTNLYNKMHFLDIAESEISRGERQNLCMQMILFDIDYFKVVNDTYGHDCRDYILKAIADTVKNQLRYYDIFARYGGEEFIILSTHMPQEDSFNFAERLRKSVEERTFIYKGQSIKITASFGLIKFSPSIGVKNAIILADEAMYSSKRKGRNQVTVIDKCLNK